MLLFDQNLSAHLPRHLLTEYPSSAHVREFGLAKASDSAVAAFAAANGYVLVTKDEDFTLASSQGPAVPKVIWIRLGNCPTSLVVDLLRTEREVVEAFIAAPDRFVLELGGV